ncbi:hypothetical protein LX36DRAFT_658501 [Colletotrichum falcatum]|nr:hypothetical protein LX36DRAFT_658501 [Colletotrichum falcatum]
MARRPSVQGPALPHNPVNLIPDEGSECVQSELGSGAASSNLRVLGSVFRFREENGQRYHAYKDKSQ